MNPGDRTLRHSFAGVLERGPRHADSDQLDSKKPDRCGGDACIRDHRIPVWALVNYRRLAGAMPTSSAPTLL